MEFWNGWFDHYGTQHHIRTGDDAADELAGMLAAGRSVSLYLAHGGTNFGPWAGANAGPNGELEPTVTSYDYDAPIAEDGRLTEKFHAFRRVISEHTGVEPPAPPDDHPVQPERRVAVDSFVGLHAVLDQLEPVTAPTPETFEHLGLHHGVVRYRTSIAGPISGSVSITGLADLAELRLDGQLIGRLGGIGLDPGFPETSTQPPIVLGEGDHDLDITVFSLGRVNFGPYLGSTKGLATVRLDYQHLFGYEQFALELTELPDLGHADPGHADLGHADPGHADPGHADLGHADLGRGGQPTTGEPGFYRANVTIDEPADTYLELPGWQLGYVYLNGFNLGRYWNPAGPQKTLYAPAPLWRAGENELIVLEFGEPGTEIVWRRTPNLG